MSLYERTDRPTAEELSQLPVTCRSQADNLHYEDEEEDGTPIRFWLSRCGVADGEPYENTVTIEVYDGDRWDTYVRYDGGELVDA